MSSITLQHHAEIALFLIPGVPHIHKRVHILEYREHWERGASFFDLCWSKIRLHTIVKPSQTDLVVAFRFSYLPVSANGFGHLFLRQRILPVFPHSPLHYASFLLDTYPVSTELLVTVQNYSISKVSLLCAHFPNGARESICRQLRKLYRTICISLILVHIFEGCVCCILHGMQLRNPEKFYKNVFSPYVHFLVCGSTIT